MKTLVISKQLYTERGCLDGGMVVEDGIISKIYLRKELPDAFDGEVQDFGDCRVIPGLIYTVMVIKDGLLCQLT